jgi:hypothetical protein
VLGQRSSFVVCNQRRSLFFASQTTADTSSLHHRTCTHPPQRRRWKRLLCEVLFPIFQLLLMIYIRQVRSTHTPAREYRGAVATCSLQRQTSIFVASVRPPPFRLCCRSVAPPLYRPGVLSLYRFCQRIYVVADVLPTRGAPYSQHAPHAVIHSHTCILSHTCTHTCLTEILSV